jgi:hypothetical protein
MNTKIKAKLLLSDISIKLSMHDLQDLIEQYVRDVFFKEIEKLGEPIVTCNNPIKVEWNIEGIKHAIKDINEFGALHGGYDTMVAEAWHDFEQENGIMLSPILGKYGEAQNGEKIKSKKKITFKRK